MNEDKIKQLLKLKVLLISKSLKKDSTQYSNLINQIKRECAIAGVVWPKKIDSIINWESVLNEVIDGYGKDSIEVNSNFFIKLLAENKELRMNLEDTLIELRYFQVNAEGTTI